MRNAASQTKAGEGDQAQENQFSAFHVYLSLSARGVRGSTSFAWFTIVSEMPQLNGELPWVTPPQLWDLEDFPLAPNPTIDCCIWIRAEAIKSVAVILNRFLGLPQFIVL